jgi:dTDP-4-dehydrorhamnose reductase
MNPLEIWGGIECSQCRVGKDYYNQLSRSGQLRPTLLSKMVRALASGQPFQHTVMQSPGWWQRPQRILFRTSGAEVRMMNEKDSWLHSAEALQALTHAG